ncbi:histidine kinase [Frankia torreyi]|uniref:Histidine kinase n=1 Tax=Frankia torreyi TaxID=1856 RepID=A0A0D8B7T6_9ACTN|nr:MULTISPECIES: DUF5931 domain-containing protein [Frankia]KJE20333.1 histidine kinase [Frankia torreyi]KQM02669.1 histidine kinase [Frankia sp. CpI1-P]
MRGALWRSLTVYRWASLAYAVALVGQTLGQADRPALGFTLFGVMAAWSLVMSVLAPVIDGRRPRLLAGLVAADVALCAAMVVLTLPVGPRSGHVLPGMWSAGGVLGAALLGGTAGGLVAGLLLSIATFIERGVVNDSSIGTAVLFLLSGTIVGYLSRTALVAETALADVLAARAGDAERERLARRVHDGVLQALALISREAPRGLPAAEVAAMAAEQEAALRELLRTPAASRVTAGASRVTAGVAGGVAGVGAPRPGNGISADLVEPLLRLARPAAPGRGAVTVATPGAPVPLEGERAREVVAAVEATVDNVARHAGPGASAWVLVEDDGDRVVVTVRDDGVGMAAGRMERAAAEGRLGLAVSVRGRIRELGGTVTVTSRPGAGTEVELRVPR